LFAAWQKSDFEYKMSLLVPLPSYGFDPTEVAIPWQVLSERGIEVIFATPNGGQGTADKLTLTGEKLGILKPLLQARDDAVAAHNAMLNDDSFRRPLKYAAARHDDFDALLLPRFATVLWWSREASIRERGIPLFTTSKPLLCLNRRKWRRTI